MFAYRFIYEKFYPATFLGHLDLVRAFVRAVRRSNLPVCYSRGFTERPLVSFGPPLPFGYAGREELVDVRLEAWMSPNHVMEEINAGLPGGVKIISGALIDLHSPAIAAATIAAQHTIMLGIPREKAEKKLNAFDSAQDFWVDITRGERKKRRNLKEFIAELGFIGSSPGTVKVDVLIRFFLQGTVPAKEAAAAIFGLSDEEAGEVTITRGRFYCSLEPRVALFIP